MKKVYIVIWQDENTFVFDNEGDAIDQIEQILGPNAEYDESSPYPYGIDDFGNQVYMVEGEWRGGKM